MVHTIDAQHHSIFFAAEAGTEGELRSGEVKEDSRILRRDGTIAWIHDLEGEAKDRVIPEFVKSGDSLNQTVKQHNKLWSLFETN